MVKRIFLVLLLILLSSLLVYGYGDWQADTLEGFELHKLEALIEELEGAIIQAEEGKSAHPAFLQHLHDILEGFKKLLAQIPLEDSQWGDYSFIESRDMGRRTSHTIKGITMYMHLAPRGTFPTGVEDDGEATVLNDFWIAETPVTYGLWYLIRIWGEENGYTFANMGREGSHGERGNEPTAWRNEPVTDVSWYDVIVWCNALSEFLGYEPVYLYHGTIYRDAKDRSAGGNVVQELGNGFRLPTDNEFELAARYQGSDSAYALEYPEGSGAYWTPGNYASGAIASHDNLFATLDAAWYKENTEKTQVVGLKPSLGNGLGLFDMSGNVEEWTYSARALGGSWNSDADELQVGSWSRSSSKHSSNNGRGFRLAKN